MEKESIKKIVLYVSLFPYVYLILSSLYYAIFGYTYNFAGAETIFGMEAFLNNIMHKFWFDNFIMFNFIGFFCTCCMIYQIWYFIKGRDIQIQDKKKINIKKILFIISLLVWIVYFSLGIYALFFGYDSGWFYTTRIYGLEAFIEAMLWNLITFTFIPILPITLLYIIIYLISKDRQRK